MSNERTIINYDTLTKLVDEAGSRKRFVEHVLGRGANKSLSYFKDRNITTATLHKICDYLGVTMEMLTASTPAVSTTAPADTTTLAMENKFLRAQIAQLKEVISAKDELIQNYRKMSDISPTDNSLA